VHGVLHGYCLDVHDDALAGLAAVAPIERH
jgi:hypothetical protein